MFGTRRHGQLIRVIRYENIVGVRVGSQLEGSGHKRQDNLWRLHRRVHLQEEYVIPGSRSLNHVKVLSDIAHGCQLDAIDLLLPGCTAGQRDDMGRKAILGLVVVEFLLFPTNRTIIEENNNLLF